MGFQIVNIEGQEIPLERLDNEISNLWSVPLVEGDYVSPHPEDHKIYGEITNWKDYICYHIEYPKPCIDWTTVRYRLMSSYVSNLALLSEDDRISLIKSANEDLRPYYAVIDYWESKEYQPVYITG